MVDDRVQGVKSEMSETEVLVPVLLRAPGVFAVIDMEHGNLILPDETVEFTDHIIKVPDNVVAAVTGVAGVKADPQLLAVSYAVIYARQFLESPISDPFPAIVSSAM